MRCIVYSFWDVLFIHSEMYCLFIMRCIVYSFWDVLFIHSEYDYLVVVTLTCMHGNTNFKT